MDKTTKKFGKPVMDRAARDKRDAELCQLYAKGYTAAMLTEKYDLTRAGLFSILQRNGVPTRSGTKRATLHKYDPLAQMLVAGRVFKDIDKAQAAVKLADYYATHMHNYNEHRLGITQYRVNVAQAKLRDVGILISSPPRRRVVIPAKRAVLYLTPRGFLELLAEPFAYIMAHKEDIEYLDDLFHCH